MKYPRINPEAPRNYYAVRGAQRRIAITAANIELQSRTFTLIENLSNLGEASEFDLSRAQIRAEKADRFSTPNANGSPPKTNWS